MFNTYLLTHTNYIFRCAPIYQPVERWDLIFVILGNWWSANTYKRNPIFSTNLIDLYKGLKTNHCQCPKFEFICESSYFRSFHCFTGNQCFFSVRLKYLVSCDLKTTDLLVKNGKMNAPIIYIFFIKILLLKSHQNAYCLMLLTGTPICIFKVMILLDYQISWFIISIIALLWV